MQFAVFLPNFGPFGDTDALVELARDAEANGWNGFFIWDHIQLDGADTGPIVDPWVALTAVACATTTLRIGTMITPLARRRPWKVARETVTLDRVSDGRLTFGVGLGYPPEDEFGTFGEETDDRVRADKLDEGLEILDGLWSGEKLDYQGEHSRSPAPSSSPGPSRSRGSRSGAAAGGRTNARSGAPRAGMASPPSSPRRVGSRPPIRSAKSRPTSRSTAPATRSTSRSTATRIRPPASRWARSPSTRRPASHGGWSGSTPTDFSHSTKHNSESTLALPNGREDEISPKRERNTMKKQHRRSRALRWVGIVSLVALFGVALAACGSGGSDTTGGTEGEASSGSGETINLLTWETYDEPEWLKEFEEESGIKVNSTNVGSPAEMFSKVKANPGQYDIVLNTAGWFPQYVDGDLLVPIEESKVPEMKNIKLGFDWKGSTTVDNELYGVLYNWGTQPMGWIPSQVKGLNLKKYENAKGELYDWNVLWDPALKGKVSLFDDPTSAEPMVPLGARVQGPLQPRRRRIRSVRKETDGTAPADQAPDQRFRRSDGTVGRR